MERKTPRPGGGSGGSFGPVLHSEIMPSNNAAPPNVYLAAPQQLVFPLPDPNTKSSRPAPATMPKGSR